MGTNVLETGLKLLLDFYWAFVVPADPRSVIGTMLGTAVGDALGLPYEALSKVRATKLLGPPDRHRLLFGRGMISDDTEHTILTAQALLASQGDVELFRAALASRLRFWLLALPAGVGFASLRSILKLWFGVSPARSGVFSAGNGPAMRAAILGVSIADLDQLRAHVKASSRLTHTDPRAEQGALTIALAARVAGEHVKGSFEHAAIARFETLFTEVFRDDRLAEELRNLMAGVFRSVRAEQSTASYAATIGQANGVSGYVFHSVPVAIHAWLSNPIDFRSAVSTVICRGGDTDSTAAMVGGVVGASVGVQGIPPDWLTGLRDWPNSVGSMHRLCSQLSNATKANPATNYFAALARNLVFIAVIVMHLARRALPPY